MHLLISTRSDPLISLARLRARGQVAEVRAYHLQFTPEEAQTHLNNEIADLDLPVDAIQALVKETKGWAAALQLALNSLMQRQEASIQAFIDAFRGTHRHLFDYLSEEVLAVQPPEVQSFLLGSSILAQMGPNRCDTLLGIDNSREILETLEDQNLFTMVLDDRREWYRYHHLFRDFLHEQSRRQKGDEVRTLHLRAVAFFETADDISQVGSSSRAIQAIEESLAHAQHLSDRVVLAERTIFQGVVYRTAGRLSEAMRSLKRGLKRLETRDALGAHIAHS